MRRDPSHRPGQVKFEMVEAHHRHLHPPPGKHGHPSATQIRKRTEDLQLSATEPIDRQAVASQPPDGRTACAAQRPLQGQEIQISTFESF